MTVLMGGPCQGGYKEHGYKEQNREQASGKTHCLCYSVVRKAYAIMPSIICSSHCFTNTPGGGAGAGACTWNDENPVHLLSDECKLLPCLLAPRFHSFACQGASQHMCTLQVQTNCAEGGGVHMYIKSSSCSGQTTHACDDASDSLGIRNFETWRRFKTGPPRSPKTGLAELFAVALLGPSRGQMCEYGFRYLPVAVITPAGLSVDGRLR